jgi:SAM-dependent methyltransferase
MVTEYAKKDLQADTETPCPHCSGPSSLLVSTTDRNRRTTDRVFNYLACSQCGLVFMQSPPEDLSPFYKGGYEKIPETLTELRAAAKPDLYRLKPILKYKKSGLLLEIGPWRGAFSCNMKYAGFDVTAIEMDPACVQFLREKVGVKTIQSAQPAEAMKGLEPGFDVIAAWHSLEHIPDPWLVIEQAARLLSPGGLLVLALPNPDSYEFSLLKGAWRHLDAPRHLYFFPIKSLRQVCGNYGLTPLEITTADKLSRILSKDAWRFWASSWIPIRYLRGLVGRTVGEVLYRWAYKAQMTEGRGSGYTAVFVRRG